MRAPESEITMNQQDQDRLGPTAPLIPGYIGCIGIRPDGSRVLARAVPDPLAKQ
jgi:hypothetical protein